MKKLFIIASFLVVGAVAQAQDFKPTKGSITTDFGVSEGLLDTELEFAEYGNNTGNGLLRLRYFMKNDLAIRLGFGARTSSDNDNVFGNNPNEIGYRKVSFNAFNVNLGIEKHFKGTERLSPYVGADLQIGSSKQKIDYSNFNNYTYNTNNAYTRKENNPRNVSLGLRGVIGADYYFTKGIFLGVEAGLGFNYNKNGKTENIDHAGTVTTFESNHKQNNINNYVVSAIRLGFKF